MIVISAPAKINLYLHVVGKESNGYHSLDSLVAFTDVADVVSVEESTLIEVETVGQFAHYLTNYLENIVFKTAKNLQRYLGVNLGAKIILKKNIPVASGLGGGSSDAAATIKALTKLWKIEHNMCSLSEFALSLGADVPMCLYGRAGFMGGIGEKITLIKSLPMVHIVLLNPGIQVSTSKVFKNFSKPYSKVARFKKSPGTLDELVSFLEDNRDNDLKKIAITSAPEIKDVLDFFHKDPKCKFANMSGSGATCFGLFSDCYSALAAVRRSERDHPKWWAVATQLAN